MLVAQVHSQFLNACFEIAIPQEVWEERVLKPQASLIA